MFQSGSEGEGGAAMRRPSPTPVAAAGQHRLVGARRAPASAMAVRAGPCPPAHLNGVEAKGLPSWRIVRYADDFAVLVDGTQETSKPCTKTSAVLAPLGLRPSPAKTRMAHMSEGFDFLGFHIQWKRKRGTNRGHVYTFIADRPIRSLKAKYVP